ncbi:MAG: hypothetical protein WC197_03705 [Candidatus Gastranaerophilaceae bacterium]|jgi:Flp pilus assembly pilin Flp
MKSKKGISLVEYSLIFMMTAVIMAAVINQFKPDVFKRLFEYTFEFKQENGTEVQIGPITD